MSWSHGTFHWNELVTHDPDRAKTFYAATLGWSFEAMPVGEGMTYWLAKMGDQAVGGMFDLRGQGCAGVGRFVILREPGGAGVGWITPAGG